jgi:HD-like signal output (HDOD) protein
VATAALVQSVASPANRPHAQAAGLLQDVGRLICLAVEGDRLTAVDLATATAEGVPFRDVGVELLHLWGVPPPIVVAVAQRDTPQQAHLSGLGVTAAVRTAHLLIERAETGGDGAHEEELALLLSHPQLKAQSVDWRRAAEDARRQAEGEY